MAQLAFSGGNAGYQNIAHAIGKQNPQTFAYCFAAGQCRQLGAVWRSDKNMTGNMTAGVLDGIGLLLFCRPRKRRGSGNNRIPNNRRGMGLTDLFDAPADSGGIIGKHSNLNCGNGRARQSRKLRADNPRRHLPQTGKVIQILRADAKHNRQRAATGGGNGAAIGKQTRAAAAVNGSKHGNDFFHIRMGR